MTNGSIVSDSDVEALFQTRDIAYIKQFNSDLERDIDKKREDLRTTVGERYRDLMEAAETITHMKTTSLEVVNAFKRVTETTSKFDYYPKSSIRSSISYKQELHLQNDVENQEDTDNIMTTDLALAAEIKLLMDSPEIIWSAVDNSDYLTAVQVFLFARHIHTNLTLQADSVAGQKLSSRFPIVERQWSSILPFHDAILSGSTRLMSDETVESDFKDTFNSERDVCYENFGTKTIDVTVRCMAAMTLLKGLNEKKLFLEFLRLRESSIKKKIFSEEHGAKSHIKTTMRAIIFCIQSCAAFLPDAKAGNNLRTLLKSISEVPAVSLFQNVSVSPVMKYLPGIIRDFSPSVVIKKDDETSNIGQKDVIDEELLKLECTNWLDRVHDMISDGTSKVLAHVNTINGLSMIRRNIYYFLASKVSKQSQSSLAQDWNKACLLVLNRSVNIWDEFYRNIFRDRIEELITKKIEDAVKYLQSSLTSATDLNHENVAEFVWSEPSINEITIRQSHKNEKQKKGYTSLELKARAYPPTVQKVCQTFSSMLQSLICELSEYVGNSIHKQNSDETNTYVNTSKETISFLEGCDSDGWQESTPFLINQDNSSILKFVENSMETHVTKMLEEVRLKVEKELKCEATTVNRKEHYVRMARICQAIPELCPSLEECASASTSVLQTPAQEASINKDYLLELKQLGGKINKTSSEVNTRWIKIKEEFMDMCSFLFISWINCLGSTLKKVLKQKLENNYEANLNLLPQWETVEISEEGEDGKHVTSVIRVPNQISIGFHDVLYQHVSSIYSIGSHNLPLNGWHSKIHRFNHKFI